MDLYRVSTLSFIFLSVFSLSRFYYDLKPFSTDVLLCWLSLLAFLQFDNK